MVLYPNKLPESERVCSGICNLPWIEFFRKGNRQSQSCQCRHSAASEAQKSSSPLVSVFFLFSLARLFLPPLDAEKIIPEVANRPNRGK